MLDKLREKKKLLFILLLITIIIIIGGLIGRGLKDTSITEKNGDKNYITSQSEVKENNSEKVKEEKRVENFIISNTKIVYEKEISTLTADIKNTSIDVNGLIMKVIFLDDNSQVITEKEFEINIKENESMNISIDLNEDVSNTNLVWYEIVE